MSFATPTHAPAEPYLFYNRVLYPTGPPGDLLFANKVSHARFNTLSHIIIIFSTYLYVVLAYVYLYVYVPFTIMYPVCTTCGVPPVIYLIGHWDSSAFD